MYPRIIIDKAKLIDNVNIIKSRAQNNGISNITVVVKAFAGNVELVKELKNAGVSCIGDSRMENLKVFKPLKFHHQMLLRIPMLSEAEDVVKYSDISLQSELEVIKAVNQAAKKLNKKHPILLMFDLGDLREGLYYQSDYLPIVKKICKLDNIILKGIATNLTCYGGLIPTRTVLNRLVEIKNKIEQELNIKLDIVSGGNSSTVTLFDQSEIPADINHLRLGESILFGKETSYGNPIPGVHHDVFRFEAEIIELKEKPSYPDGEMSINSFGEKPDITDKGMMKRAILAIGKQDTILENLKPLNRDIEIIGGSSDHLILDVTKAEHKVGDIIQFEINYPALVHLMNSSYVNKIIK